MYRDKLDLKDALELESKGAIVICDLSGENFPPIDTQDNKGVIWKENFIALQRKFRHIAPEKLLDFASCRFTIEVKELSDEETGMFSWRYLHALETPKIKELTTDNLEYVYILVNDASPELIKIGMTLRDIPSRVKGMNTSAVLNEWYPKFGLALEKGSAFNVEQQLHKHFASLRVSSDKGNSREFFTLDALTAFDKMRDIGSLFMVGNPIVF